jgi:hypothetical protein
MLTALDQLRALCSGLSDPAPLLTLAGRMTGADWDGLVALANAHLVTPALHANLHERQALGFIPEEPRAFLQAVYELNAARNRDIRAQLGEIGSAARSAGIEILLVKGSADVLVAPDERLGVRILSDIDVLVHLNDLPRARQMLGDLGYRKVSTEDDPRTDGNYAREGAAAPIDLHVSLLFEDELLPAAGLWRNSEALTLHGGLRRPAAGDRLLHVLLHHALHHHGHAEASLSVRALNDLAAMMRNSRNEIDWCKVETFADEWRLRPLVETQLIAVEELFGVAWPLRRPATIVARSQYRLLLLAHARRGVRISLAAWGRLLRPFAYHRVKIRYGRDGGVALVWRARRAAAILRRIVAGTRGNKQSSRQA